MPSHETMIRTLALVATAQIVFVTARLPHAGYSKRAAEIERIRELGPARYHLEKARMRGSSILERVRTLSPENAIVLYRGRQKGALEFAPPSLWPRLLYAAGALRPGRTSVHGRPLAQGPDGPLVLVGLGHAIELATR